MLPKPYIASTSTGNIRLDHIVDDWQLGHIPKQFISNINSLLKTTRRLNWTNTILVQKLINATKIVYMKVEWISLVSFASQGNFVILGNTITASNSNNNDDNDDGGGNDF